MLIRPLKIKLFNRIEYICPHCNLLTTSYVFADYVGYQGQGVVQCKKCKNYDNVYVTKKIF